MKNSFNFNPGLYRMIILLVCTMLLLVFSASRAEQPFKITEVKVWQTTGDAISVQVRSDDGRPVKFELVSEAGAIVSIQSVIHSKVTLIKGLKKGLYIYNCVSHDNDEFKGKINVK